MAQGDGVKTVLFLTHENPQGYRIQQYFPFLERRGFTVELLTTRANFFTVLERTRHTDILYIQRILFDPLKLALLRKLATRIVFDFDDAVMYGTRGESTTRRKKFKLMAEHADALLCGNYFLMHEAQKYKTHQVYYVPTVVDTGEYEGKVHEEHPVCVVGWMGSSSTLQYLSDIQELMLSLATVDTIRFCIIADREPTFVGNNIYFEKWKKEKENRLLLGFDVGMMPLREDIWSKGKCGLKLIQYMAAGLPSISHPLGVARDIISHGINGFLVQTQEEWRNTIIELAGNVGLRRRIGQHARHTVEEKFSLTVWGPKVAEILDNL